jgi:hypothetical protein
MTTNPKPAFVELDSITRIASVLLLLHLVMSLVAVASGWAERELLVAARDGVYFGQGSFQQKAAASDTRQALVAVAQFAIFVIAGIGVLVWTHRANRNAHALSPRPLAYTPGWAVGWYFIPIANLFKPYKAMEATWNASRDPLGTQPVRDSSLLGAWWLLWIVTCLLSRAATRMSARAEDTDSLVQASGFMLASDVLEVPLTVLLLLVMRAIARMQASAASNASRTEVVHAIAAA